MCKKECCKVGLENISKTGDMILRGKSWKEEKSEACDKEDGGEDGPGEETEQKRKQTNLRD